MKIVLPKLLIKIKLLSTILVVFSFNTLAGTAENYEKALTSFNKSEFKESYIHLKNALQESPEHLPSKLLMARILLIDGYVDDAITELLEVLNAGVDMNLVLIPLANAYLIKRDYQKIIDLTIPRTASTTNRLDLLILKANAYTQLKNYVQAEELYSNGLLIASHDVRLMIGLCQLALLNNDLNKARELNNQVLNLDNNNAQGLLYSGLIYQASNESTKAMQMFLRAYEISAQDPLILRALANAYAQNNDIEQAKLIVEKIELANPNDLQNKLLKARLFALENKNEEASTLLSELANLMSLASDEDKEKLIWVSLINGITANVVGNYDVSVRELAKYIQNKQPNPGLLLILAEGYIKQGNTKQALQTLEQHQKIVLEDLPASSLLCELYITANKMFKCYALLGELKAKHQENEALLLIEARLLAQRGQYQNALDLLAAKLPNVNSLNILVFKTTMFAKLQEFNQALEISKQALQLAPNNIDLVNLNVDLLIRLLQFPAAEELLLPIIAVNPENIAANINMSRLLFSKDQLDEALNHLTTVIKLEPKNTIAMLLAGQILSKQQKYDQAIEQIIAAKTINSSDTEPRELLVSIYKVQGQLSNAHSELDSLLKLKVLEPKYLLEKAKLYLQQQKFNDAISQLNLLYGIWSREPNRLVELSRYQILANDFAGAETSLKQAQELTPGLLLAKLEYATLLIRKNDLRQAREVLNKLDKDFPKNANIALLWGHFYKANEQKELAYAAYQLANKLSPGFDAALIELYQIAISSEHLDEVKNILQKQIKSQPDKPFLQHLLADLMFIHKEYQQAQVLYMSLIEIENLPNKANIYNNLANIYGESDLKQALIYASQALQLDNNSSSILDTYGWLLTINNEPQKALNILRQAFTLKSNDPTIRYHIAYTLNMLGRVDEAKIELQQLLKSAVVFPEKALAEKLLKEI